MASDITSTTQWKALENHHNSLREVTLRELFDADPSRASTLTFNAAGLHVDLSKNRVNDETLALLIDLANAAGLKEKTDAMFTGAHLNNTEDRAVLHTALRLPPALFPTLTQQTW